MAFRIKLNDISVETDSIYELDQVMSKLGHTMKPSIPIAPLLDILSAREERKKALLVSNQKCKSVQGRKKRVMSGWTNEHFKFLADNLEDRDALTALPFKKKEVTRIRWAFRNNRPYNLPALGKKALEEYNKKKTASGMMEYLPKL